MLLECIAREPDPCWHGCATGKRLRARYSTLMTTAIVLSIAVVASVGITIWLTNRGGPNR